MSLLFLRNERGEVKALRVKSGEVLDIGDLPNLDSRAPSSVELMGLTKMQLKDLLSGLNLGISNFDKCKKEKVIDIILDKWSYITTKASARSSSVNETIPSSGLRNLSQYLAENYKDVKGFHCGFYEGGLFHIFTPYGMYAPDGQEFEEFIRNNNCVILSVEDKKDDEAVSEGNDSSSASVNDTAKIEEQIEPEPEAVEAKPDASTSASVAFKPFVIEIGFDIRESDIDAEFVLELAEMFPMEYEVLSPLTTVRELIGYINMKCNLVEKEYKLQFVGEGFAFSMPHGDTLGQYNKGNDPSILCEIVLKQMPSVKVIVFNRDDTKEFYFDPRASTIGDIKNAICIETGNELQSFHLTFEGKPLPHYRRVAEYILEGEFKVSIVASGLAGGAVKKGFLKPKKTTKNTVADKNVYDTAYNTAIAIDTANGFVLKGYLENMSNEKLVALSDYLTTDRSIYATKLKNIHTFFPSFEELQMVINKAMVATETLQSLVSDDIDKTFGLDDAKEAVEGVKGLLREIIAVKSYQSRGGYTGNASMDADL